MTTTEACRQIAMAEIVKMIDNLIIELADIYDHEKNDDILVAVRHLENSRFLLTRPDSEARQFLNMYPRGFYND